MKQLTTLLGLAVLFFAGTQMMAQNQEPAVKKAVAVKEVKAPVATPVDVSGQNSTEKKSTGAEFKFEEETYNFGQIEQGDIVEHTFYFQNVGTEDLVIQNIKVTCGCTTPSYSKTAVPPGGNGEIQAKFNSRGKMGTQMKSLTIYYGADMPKIVYLKGEVKPKTETAPDNNGGQ